jgi:hypothetical protein
MTFEWLDEETPRRPLDAPATDAPAVACVGCPGRRGRCCKAPGLGTTEARVAELQALYAAEALPPLRRRGAFARLFRRKSCLC